MKFLKKLFNRNVETENQQIDDSEILIESFSPSGNADAFVERKNSVIYLYLRKFTESEKHEVHAVWVRNLDNAPEEFQVDLMRAGHAPMMPKANCVNPTAGQCFNIEDLRLVWTEEGDAVALYEKNALIAIIPSWSGFEGFSGFSVECSESNSLAMPLEHDNVLIPRFNNAKEYWDAWDKGDFWDTYQEDMLSRITNTFGEHSKYFAIDGGEWPPRAMVLIENENFNQLVTLGISLRPQPTVESYVEDYNEYNRFEFVWAFSKDFTIDEIKKFGSYISGQATMPWKLNTWLGNGHTIGCDVVDGFNSVLLINSLASIQVRDLGKFRDSKINLLYLVPLTKKEQEFAINNSSQELALQLTAKGITQIFQRGLRDRS